MNIKNAQQKHMKSKNTNGKICFCWVTNWGTFMKLSLYAFLPLLLITAVPAQARFGEGFLVGGFAGLTAGLITGAIAQRCAPCREVVVYEQPVVVRRPVLVRQRPCFVRRYADTVWYEDYAAPREVVVQKRAVAAQPQKFVEKTSVHAEQAQLKEKELALKQQELELKIIREKKALLQEENRKAELALQKTAQVTTALTTTVTQ